MRTFASIFHALFSIFDSLIFSGNSDELTGDKLFSERKIRLVQSVICCIYRENDVDFPTVISFGYFIVNKLIIIISTCEVSYSLANINNGLMMSLT